MSQCGWQQCKCVTYWIAYWNSVGTEKMLFAENHDSSVPNTFNVLLCKYNTYYVIKISHIPMRIQRTVFLLSNDGPKVWANPPDRSYTYSVTSSPASPMIKCLEWLCKIQWKYYEFSGKITCHNQGGKAKGKTTAK